MKLGGAAAGAPAAAGDTWMGGGGDSGGKRMSMGTTLAVARQRSAAERQRTAAAENERADHDAATLAMDKELAALNSSKRSPPIVTETAAAAVEDFTVPLVIDNEPVEVARWLNHLLGLDYSSKRSVTEQIVAKLRAVRMAPAAYMHGLP